MIIRGVVYNLIGMGLPLVIAAASIPILVNALGVDKFGLLTLIWAVVSYFGIFDLGLSRALTRQLSIAIVNKKLKIIGPMIWTALFLMLLMGGLSSLFMTYGASQGAGAIKTSVNKSEIVEAINWMAVAVPFIVLTSGLRGALEAKGLFGVINIIRLPMGVFTFIGPVLVVKFICVDLSALTQVLVIGRIIAFFVHVWCVVKFFPEIRDIITVDKKLIRELCATGGWLTVGNIASSFIGYVDRFLIGLNVSASAVAYYVTPNELVTKLWIIPGALTSVIFPKFSTDNSKDIEDNWGLYKKSIAWLFVALLPIVLVLALFSYEILNIWIGNDMAKNSSAILKIMTIGIFVNCMAHVPFTVVQGGGYAKLTAVINCVELPFYAGLVWWLSIKYGVVGASVAWLARMILDTVLMFLVSSFVFNKSKMYWICKHSSAMVLTAAAGFSGMNVESIEIRVAIIIFVSLYALSYVKKEFS